MPMISTFADVLRAVPLVLVYAPMFLGGVFVWNSLAGALLFAMAAGAAYLGVRLSRDSRRGRAIRRLALAAGVCCALLAAGSIPCAFIASAEARFGDWVSAGAGLHPGQTLDEARRVLAQRSTVSESEPPGFKGVSFQVEPKGLAGYRFGITLGTQYFLDVLVDAEGRVAAVKPRED